MPFSTIAVECDGDVRRISFARPDAKNAINNVMVRELEEALFCPVSVRAVVIEGSPAAFCVGADFHESGDGPHEPERLYNVWRRLSAGPFISIAHVRGRVTAGGIGFVAACDLVLADFEARFSLPELLFGLAPANVAPFLVRRIGRQRAHYLALSSRVIWAEQACEWGLVDEVEADSVRLVRTHLQRVARLRPEAIARYKRFMSELADEPLSQAMSLAARTSRQMFAEPQVMADIGRYARTGEFPWQERGQA